MGESCGGGRGSRFRHGRLLGKASAREKARFESTASGAERSGAFSGRQGMGWLDRRLSPSTVQRGSGGGKQASL